MSEERTLMYRLNDTNYAFWSDYMEGELTRRDLWFGITELDSMVSLVGSDGKMKALEVYERELEVEASKRDAKLMAKARAEMIIRVEPGQLAHMSSKDPREVWKALEDAHLPQGFGTTLALRRRFLTMKMGKDQSISSWIGQVKALAHKMQKSAILVPDYDIILALTLGLPPSYQALVVSFDTIPNEELMLKYVTTRLTNDSYRQQHKITIDDDSDDVDLLTREEGPGSAMAAAANFESVTCFFCDRKGHIKSDCPKRKEWLAARKGSKRKGTAASALEALTLDDSESSDGDWC